MKKVLYGLLAVLAVVGVVQAAQNLRQNPDGTADLISSNFQANPYGAAHVQLVISLNAVNGSTHFVVSPLTDAKIVDAHIARQSPLSGGRALIAFQVQGITAPVQLQSTLGTTTTVALTDATINVGVATNVTTYSLTAVSAVTNGRLVNNVVERGKFLTVFVTGANTIATTGHLIITIAPK